MIARAESRASQRADDGIRRRRDRARRRRIVRSAGRREGTCAARSRRRRRCRCAATANLLTQALANLVDNAIKYAGAERAAANGAPAEIVITARHRRATDVLLDGDRPRAGHRRGRPRPRGRALRAPGASRSEPGSGLGLSLVSAVAHLHGGELKFDDNGPGLKATLVLPRAAPAAASSRRPEPLALPFGASSALTLPS